MNGHLNKIIFFLSAIVLSAGEILSQTQLLSESDTTSFSEIFSASINAMGGEKELGKIHSIAALADCIGPKGK